MKIRLTESKLRQIVNESIKKVLKENDIAFNNITPEEVLEIINNAINENNFEVVDNDLKCKTRYSERPSMINFDGDLYIAFYGDGDTEVHVQVNIEAWLEIDDDYIDYKRQTNVEIENIETIKFCDGKTCTTVNMENKLNRVNKIINSDIVYERLVDDVSHIIKYIMSEQHKEHQYYLDREMDRYIDARNGK